MKNTDLKSKIFIIIVISIIIGTILLYIYKITKEQDDYYELNEEIEENIEEIGSENIEENITVHITGEVNYPGVVVLKYGDRVVDAIEAAGGETQEADLNKLNLAYILNDGEKIYVPSKNDENIEYISTAENTDSDTAINRKVNINTASKDELSTLPGVGEATADKIIEYRKTNGKFNTIEEIKNVSGIGNSKFENLKDKIIVK